MSEQICTEIEADRWPRADPSLEHPGALRTHPGKQKNRVCRSFMELAGLEPATSWVRFRSAALTNPHHERVSGQSSGSKPLGYPALTRGFWG
jgi:hypothetical protein